MPTYNCYHGCPIADLCGRLDASSSCKDLVAVFERGLTEGEKRGYEKEKREDAKMKDAAEMLWVVLANVSGGDWTKQTADWQEAAARGRDNYFVALAPKGEE